MSTARRLRADVDALPSKHAGQAIGAQKIAVGQAVAFGRVSVAAGLAGAAVLLAGDGSACIAAPTLNVGDADVVP